MPPRDRTAQDLFYDFVEAERSVIGLQEKAAAMDAQGRALIQQAAEMAKRAEASADVVRQRRQDWIDSGAWALERGGRNA